jgi:hypothetical protein
MKRLYSLLVIEILLASSSLTGLNEKFIKESSFSIFNLREYNRTINRYNAENYTFKFGVIK